MLNLILSALLTARGDSVRGFISAADLSLKAKRKIRERLCELEESERNPPPRLFFFFFISLFSRDKTLILLWFCFTVFGWWQQKARRTPAADNANKPSARAIGICANLLGEHHTYIWPGFFFLVCLFVSPPPSGLSFNVLYSFFSSSNIKRKNQLKLCLMRCQQHTRYNLSNFVRVVIKARNAFERCSATASFVDTHQTNDAHSHFMYARTN